MFDPILPVEAIDVHGHYGHYNMNPLYEADPIRVQWMSADAAEVARRARAAATQWTVVSPLLAILPRAHADAVKGNIEAADIVPRTPGLLQWVVVDPTNPATYDQARDMLKQPRCVGIKIHPEEHIYPIERHAREMFAFAAEHRAVVLAHSGNKLSMPEAFVPFADEFPEMKLILAHIGNGEGNHQLQARAIQKSKKGNVWADTSSSMSIFPNMIEWVVAQVGAERVLYGTDTPLYHSSMQRVRIDHGNFTEAQKRLILRDNAVKLLRLAERGLVNDQVPAAAAR
jgi:predicted TIM-barrel fold metal-dependent hydrolase